MKERFARVSYSLLWWVLTPLVLTRLWLKSRHQPAYRQRFSERLGHWPYFPQRCFWVHAVSVGETIAAQGLIQQWQQQHPEIPVLVTSMTPTGSETVRKLFGHSVHHAYLPWDLASVQKKLVRRLNPRLLVIMETELWPNLIHACHEHNVPVLVANARLSAKSKRGYDRFHSLTRPMLSAITGVAAQYTPDATRFAELGIDEKQIQVTGSIKFDITIDQQTLDKRDALLEQIGDRPIWIAASTHEGEEEQILSAHSQLKAKLPNALLILVPRHPNRADHIGGLLYKQHFDFARRSLDEVPTSNQSVFLIDTLGEMMIFFGLANAAFIGNTLNGGGGHNPIEPAALGKPVIVGPSVTNFQSIIDAMRAEQAVITIETVDELKNRLLGLLQSKDLRDNYGQRAYLFYQQQQGALKRLMTWIEKIVDLESHSPVNPLLYRRKTDADHQKEPR